MDNDAAHSGKRANHQRSEQRYLVNALGIRIHAGILPDSTLYRPRQQGA
jgi:hypothetical protein